MSLVLLLARLLLAVVFLAAGLAKLADLAGSRQALRDFGVPARLATPLGLLLPLPNWRWHCFFPLRPGGARSAHCCCCLPLSPASVTTWPEVARRIATALVSCTQHLPAGRRW